MKPVTGPKVRRAHGSGPEVRRLRRGTPEMQRLHRGTVEATRRNSGGPEVYLEGSGSLEVDPEAMQGASPGPGTHPKARGQLLWKFHCSGLGPRVTPHREVSSIGPMVRRPRGSAPEVRRLCGGTPKARTLCRGKLHVRRSYGQAPEVVRSTVEPIRDAGRSSRLVPGRSSELTTSRG